MTENFLSCSKGVKDPFEVQERRFDLPPDASAEKGLISPGGENLLDFLELQQVPLEFQRCSQGTALVAQKRPVSTRVARGLPGFHSN